MITEEQYKALEKRVSFLEKLEHGGLLVDYFATSTKVGWSAYTASNLKYLIINGMMHVFFYISGTSDNAATSITLPYNCAAGFSILNDIWVQDNGTAALGYAAINSGSNILTMRRNAAGDAWTASGDKSVQGEIIIPV